MEQQEFTGFGPDWNKSPMPLDLELTDFKAGPPPCVGWWSSRLVATPVEGMPARAALKIRRYWDGLGWSAGVLEGESDGRAAIAQTIPLQDCGMTVEWAGLTQPHPDGYTQEQWDVLAKCYPAEVAKLSASE